MTNVRDNLAALIKDQRELLTKVEANQKLIERISKRVLQRQHEKTCNDRLKPFGVTVLGSLSAGSMTSTWDPSVLVRDVYVDGKSFAKIDGVWRWYSEYLGGDAYAHKLVALESMRPPFDVAEFEATCAALATELGIAVQIHEHKLVGKPESLRNTDDLLASLPGSQLIAEGKIWSMGWDISDPWALVRAQDGLHLYYATNGHGFGYDVHLGPEESRRGFLDYINSDNISADGMTDEIREMLTK